MASYKSFCWNMGTTSLRWKEMACAIERQLLLLNAFWSMPENQGREWQANPALQEHFYGYLKAHGFLSGNAGNPAKDARQKTSGLCELGLIDDNRRLTPAGETLLKVAQSGDFASDGNLLDLSRDAWIYFLQLLKCSKRKSKDWCVRPYVLLLHVLNTVGEVSWDVFARLLPLCVNREITARIVARLTSGQAIDVAETVDAILADLEGLREARETFVNARTIDTHTILQAGLNRDGSTYDASYLAVYETLWALVHARANDTQAIKSFDRALGHCRLKNYWREYFFADGKRLRRERPIFGAQDERVFRNAFFTLLHRFKAFALLDDYADLNRRYFGLSDTVRFSEGKVRLTPLAASFANAIAPWLETHAWSACAALPQTCPLETILKGQSIPGQDTLFRAATGRTREAIEAEGGLEAVLRKTRAEAFIARIDRSFPREAVIELLALLENRANDAEVRRRVSKEADVPTIFEYLLAIAWFYVSGRQGNVLDYMGLSLDADFLPKTHAGGGRADIVWRYAALPPHYPAHALLIEATLAERDTQRRMEMEPVSRHLGDYLLTHPGATAYALFVATTLHPNVVSDFRSRKDYQYYNADGTQSIVGMKIIPLDTAMLRAILERHLPYTTLHPLFDAHFHAPDAPPAWLAALRAKLSD